KPKLTQKEALTRLLDLMSVAQTTEDFSPQRLEQVFGLPVKYNETDKGYRISEQLPNSGWYMFKAYYVPPKMEQLSFRFSVGVNNTKPGSDPDMRPVCEMTMDDFGVLAKSKGFTILPRRAWGRAPILEGFDMKKGNLQAKISLTARGGPGTDWRNPGPACIKTIGIYVPEKNKGR
ncbi:hypothetical protein, partial [Neisseria sp.]